MPNHITNVIKVKEAAGISTPNIQSKILNDKRHVDFNVMCSIPDCLKDFEPDHQIVNIAYEMLKIPCSGIALIAMIESENRMRDFAAYEGLPDERKAMVQRCLDNHKKCGYVYWYDFTNDKWGTKWNAYDQPKEGFDPDSIEFRFQTAWSHPSGLIEIFSKQLPEVTFEILYADEDMGSNCGIYTIKNGEVIEMDIAPGWREQSEDQKRKYKKFAFELCHPDVDRRSYGYDENFEYSDDIYEEWEKSQKAA